jgi:hypothetical protein
LAIETVGVLSKKIDTDILSTVSLRLVKSGRLYYGYMGSSPMPLSRWYKLFKVLNSIKGETYEDTLSVLKNEEIEQIEQQIACEEI